MGNTNELKVIDIKNFSFFYFDDIISINDLGVDNTCWIKNHTEIF